MANPLDLRLRLNRLMFGHIVTQCIYVVAKLGVVDAVPHGGQLDTDAFAERAGVDANALYRVLRALAGEGLFTEVSSRAFAVTDLGELLRDGELSARYMALVHGREWMPLFKDFEQSVRTGKPITVAMQGRSRWEILAEDPELSEIFNRSMRGRATALVRAALQVDWGGVGTVVDVGGGIGGVLLPLLEAEPELRAVLFDLEHVAADARAAVTSAGLSDRCTVESGSFFERVPAGGDAYLLSNVLHDWYDDDAIRIVQRCREAAPNDAKLVVLENLVRPGDGPDWATLLDILMLAGPGGRERTDEEYRELLAAGGFELVRVSGDGPYALEARPV